MNCLGERLTALVDGELGHDERDRALAHLATCEGCRAEADMLRRLKKRLNSLSDVAPPTDLMARLYGLAEPAPQFAPAAAVPMGMPPVRTRRPGDNRPATRGGTAVRTRRMPRARTLAVSAATLAVLGVGTASFVASESPRLPKVSPSYAEAVVRSGQNSGQLPREERQRRP